MEQKIVHEFSRLRVLGKAATNSDPPSPSKKKPITSCKKMDALVHELNAALELDEVNHSSANADSGGSGGSGPANSNRRRVWRRRCKSTSNLTCLNSGSSKSTSDLLKNSVQNHSEDSSSSSDDTRAVILTNDRGTSSLQLSDSEEENAVLLSPGSLAAVKRKGFQPPQELQPQQQPQQQLGQKLMNVDTDSVNENFSPIRPSTKRKRKFKRMALDPDNSNMIESNQKGKSGTMKRKKVRSRSACESSNSVAAKSTSKGSSSKNQSASQSGQRQRQLSANVVPGKRKRSSREKSVEPDLIQHSSQSSVPSHAMISEEPSSISNEAMDCDDGSRRSSSSLSSSDWEEVEANTDESSNNAIRIREDDGEADDEQSDWPGPESGSGYGGFTDDEADFDSAFPLSSLYSNSSSTPSTSDNYAENLQSLTSTARQAYLARMKRLADCVPGREIRAGSRRLRNPQSGFTIKSSSSEQLSRFLQDPSRTELRLTVSRAADRSKIAQMATLYSLQLRYEGPNNLVLAKTGKTVRVDCFIVPKTPAAKAHPPVDVKRRRRTPPPAAPGSLIDHIMMNPTAEPQSMGGCGGALTDSPIDDTSPHSDMIMPPRRQSN